MQHTALHGPAQHDRVRPIDNILPRLLGVKRTAPDRWSARCPAHDDRGPSLSIREAQDGKVLLHDFAGCQLSAIIASLGIRSADLFPSAAEARPMHHGPVDLKRTVDDELRRIIDREEADLGFRPATLSRHVAEARTRVGRLLLRQLPPTPVRWWESEPHCTDPAWRACVERAIEERAWRCNVSPALMRDRAAVSVDVAEVVLRDAAALLRELVPSC